MTNNNLKVNPKKKKQQTLLAKTGDADDKDVYEVEIDGKRFFVRIPAKKV